jgi:hypothetical protein
MSTLLPATHAPRSSVPKDLIRPFDGPLLDRCVSDAAKRLACPIACLTFDSWYQPRPTAEDAAAGRRGVPVFAAWLVVVDTTGHGPGRCCVYDDGVHVATFRYAPPEFWMGVQERCLPERSDPWWAQVEELAREGGAAAPIADAEPAGPAQEGGAP